MDSQKLLTRKEVAALFRLSQPTVGKYARSGIFPAYEIGTRIRFKESEIEQCIKRITPKKQVDPDGK